MQFPDQGLPAAARGQQGLADQVLSRLAEGDEVPGNGTSIDWSVDNMFVIFRGIAVRDLALARRRLEEVLSHERQRRH